VLKLIKGNNVRLTKLLPKYKTRVGGLMATFKTPDELRAWSRSFYNKSSIIKRGFYNYITPDEQDNNEKTSNQEIPKQQELTPNSEIDASDIANSIIARGNASSANISELFSLDSSVIEEMNSKFPTTEEQLHQRDNPSSVLKK